MDKSESVSATNPSCGDEFKDVIKGLIKLLMLVIFLGIIFIWILMPTMVYRTKWLNPVMRNEFGTSTYFGAIGSYISIHIVEFFPLIKIIQLQHFMSFNRFCLDGMQA